MNPGRCAMFASMNIVVIVNVILSLFPRLCNLQKTEEIFNNSIMSSVVFPKDRPKSPSLRIIGGTDAIPNSYPFQVALYVNRTGKEKVSLCGGTLITPEWVLTAAHCLEDTGTAYARIYLGSHDLSLPESTKVKLLSDSFVIHEDRNAPTRQNDIALIHLPTNVTLTPYIQTIKYADDDDESYDDEIATIIGWGVTEIGNASLTLKHVNVSVMSNEECVELYGMRIGPSHLCTSGEGTTGSCNGDSGGPLITNGVQIGIVSFGPRDCNAGKPSVFTRVSHFSDWIYRTTHGLPITRTTPVVRLAKDQHTTGGCCICISLRCMVVISTIVYSLT